MNTQELHDLIDKVIGKKGPLRVPAYWMRRVMLDIIKYVESRYSEVLKEITKFKATLSSYLKYPLQYTYDELVELAFADKLVPGQQYILKDYQFTTSNRYSQCIGFEGEGSTYFYNPLIYLTARSTNTFLQTAKCINTANGNPEEWDITFFFFGNRIYAWNRCTNEVPSFTAVDQTGNLVDFTLSTLTSSYIYYSDGENTLWRCSTDEWNIGDNMKPVRYLSVGQSISLFSSTKGTVVFEVTKVNLPFRGLIAKAYSRERDVELPYDPKVSCPSFFINLPDGSSREFLGGPFNPYITNFTLKPLLKGNLYFLPRLSVSYRGDYACFIGHNCDKISIYSLDNGPIFIEGGCEDIHITTADSFCAIRIIGACSRCLINIKGSLYLTALGTCQNIEFGNNSERRYVVLGNTSYLYPSGSYYGTTFISNGKYGNIYQWNPADFVDAVDVEEQTVETVEE